MRLQLSDYIYRSNLSILYFQVFTKWGFGHSDQMYGAVQFFCKPDTLLYLENTTTETTA